MASNDNSTTPHKFHTTSITLEEGGGATLTLIGVMSLTWSQPGRAYIEARDRERHQATPALLETSDGDVSLSISGFVSSFKGTSAVHPYEALTFTGQASAWTSVAAGSKKALKITVVANGTEDGEASQTLIFAACVRTDLSIDTKGYEGAAFSFSASFVDHENAPTIS